MLTTQKIYYPKINSEINIPEDSTIEIQNALSLNIDYSKKNQACVASFDVSSVCNEHPDWFSIKIQVIGIFGYDKADTIEEKKFIHKEAYDMLFPYAQSMVSDLTTKAGHPPFILEKFDMNFSEIEIAQNEQ